MDSLYTLKWLHDMGINEIITSAPINRFATNHSKKTASQPLQKSPVHPPNTPVRTALGSDEAQKIAEHAMATVTSLDMLQTTLQDFKGCPSLKNTAKHTLCYTGTHTPEVLCIGNTPTAEDEQAGTLLNGAYARLLHRMLNAIDIPQNRMAYTTRTFWYPPGNRSINDGEATTCLPILEKIITLSNPKYILVLGGDTMKTLIPNTESLNKTNGKTFDLHIQGISYKIIPTYGLHTILSNPKRKPAVWQALQTLQSTIQK